MRADEYLDLSLGDFLDRLGTAKPDPGSGSASALTVAFAAGLVVMVARLSDESWEDSRGIAAQALALQDRAAPLALADALVWQQALEALAAAGASETPPNGELEAKLDLSAAVPLEIVEIAADTAALAALAAEMGEGAYRADAAAAAVLAAAAARAAAHLVAVNLTVQKGDVRLVQAQASEEAAAEAATRALDSAR
jgi:formiminotetrahydrofolate cyclodeaminase